MNWGAYVSIGLGIIILVLIGIIVHLKSDKQDNETQISTDKLQKELNKTLSMIKSAVEKPQTQQQPQQRQLEISELPSVNQVEEQMNKYREIYGMPTNSQKKQNTQQTQDTQQTPQPILNENDADLLLYD